METLYHAIQDRYKDFVEPLSVKAWLPSGLKEIKDDSEWTLALITSATTEWMDRQLKVIVLLPVATEAN